MCGIAGILGGSDKRLIDRMTRVMTHRGPDDEGRFVEEGICLGVRRLSIIDVEGGHQPIANEDGSVVVVFNGEIYNYRELRQRLLQKGHCFSTAADTEVIVHLYEEYGDESVHLLRGMFAYALWDRRRRRLLLVRDRLGIKPLYYATAGDDFVFASEAKALLLHPKLAREADLDSLDLYLTFQYVPGPQTLFRGVRKLPPGHLLVRQENRLEIRRYWDVVFAGAEHDVVLDEAVEEFEALFADAIRHHLISDVPVGTLLSGGIDSSAVVAGIAAQSTVPVRTFTVGFDASGMIDEREDARVVARHFSTQHEELAVRPDAAQVLPKIVWHLDEPVADAAALPTFLICQYARRGVPVVLTGEGGDELLAGYPRYAWFLLAHRLERVVPRLVRRGLLSIGLSLPLRPRYHKLAGDLLAEQDDVARHLQWIANFDSRLKREVLLPPLAARTEFRARACVSPYLNGTQPRSGGDLLQRLLNLDMHTWLVDDVLTKMDRMSMAASVEARVPFLDHRLIEFVATLPPSAKIRGTTGKRLLRHAMRDRLPARTLARRKRAFAAPVNQWLRHPLRELTHEMLLSDRLRQRGWFDQPCIERMLAAHAGGDDQLGQPLWNLLCLELWAETFLDRAPSEPLH